MTAIDDLRVGMWVAISRSEETTTSPSGTPVIVNDRLVSGVPLKILAISLPWISVTDGNYRFPLDTRNVLLQVLQRAYVKSLQQERHREQREQCWGQWKAETHRTRSPRSPIILETNRRKKKRKKTGKGCPLCEAPMVETLVGPGEWVLVCGECGFRGGLPPKEEKV